MNMPKIVSKVVRGSLIPAFVISGCIALAAGGCSSTDVEVADPSIAKTGVFSPVYIEKYDEYLAVVKQYYAAAQAAGNKDEMYLAKGACDVARLGRFMLDHGKRPEVGYAAEMITVKAMGACESKLKNVDFRDDYYIRKVKGYARMMTVSGAAVNTTTEILMNYPATDLTDEQLQTLATLEASPKPFEVAPQYTAKFEELSVELTGLYDEAKSGYDAGKNTIEELATVTNLVDEANLCVYRLKQGRSARPGLAELYLAREVSDFIRKSLQEKLRANTVTYADIFAELTNHNQNELNLYQFWQLDRHQMQQLNGLRLGYPRSPLTDSQLSGLAEMKARRAPAIGSQEYADKYKELASNRAYIVRFLQAYNTAGKATVENLMYHTYLWDLDRLALERLEKGEAATPGYPEALLSARINEYLLNSLKAKQEKGAAKPAEVLEANAKLLKAELDVIEKSQSVTPDALKKSQKIVANYPTEALRDNRVKELLTLEKQIAVPEEK